MQIHDRQYQIFCEGAIMAYNSQNAAPPAMRGNSATAIAAHFSPPNSAEPQTFAGNINFSDDAPPDPVLVFCAGDAHHVAHKFMTERAIKIMIAAQDFNIGIANSG
jgi:hypothetical protein